MCMGDYEENVFRYSATRKKRVEERKKAERKEWRGKEKIEGPVLKVHV